MSFIWIKIATVLCCTGNGPNLLVDSSRPFSTGIANQGGRNLTSPQLVNGKVQELWFVAAEARVYSPFPRPGSPSTIVLVELRVGHHFDGDSCRCAMSLRSELRIVRNLIKMGQTCWSPKLKAYVPDLFERRQKLVRELRIRGEEKHISAGLQRLHPR